MSAPLLIALAMTLGFSLPSDREVDARAGAWDASVQAENSALVTFAIYIVAVFVIAGLANRMQSKGGFVSEYFLGSKNIGMWAFALTYAATAASGGCFIGLPA